MQQASEGDPQAVHINANERLASVVGSLERETLSIELVTEFRFARLRSLDSFTHKGLVLAIRIITRFHRAS